MPTPPYIAALLAVRPGIWGYVKWQEHMEYSIPPPFANNMMPESMGLSEQNISTVKVLTNKLFACEHLHEKTLKNSTETRDNDMAGWVAWAEWVNKMFEVWKVKGTVEEVLIEEGCHPLKLINGPGFVSTCEKYGMDIH